MSLKKIVKKIIAKKKNPEESNALDFIKKDDDKLLKPERKSITEAMVRAGMDGKGRFDKIDHAISKLSEILYDNGFEFDDIMSSHKFMAESNSTTIPIARITGDPHAPVPVKNSKISLSWHLMGSSSEDKSKRKYEIVAYMS